MRCILVLRGNALDEAVYAEAQHLNMAQTVSLGIARPVRRFRCQPLERPRTFRCTIGARQHIRMASSFGIKSCQMHCTFRTSVTVSSSSTSWVSASISCSFGSIFPPGIWKCLSPWFRTKSTFPFFTTQSRTFMKLSIVATIKLVRRRCLLPPPTTPHSPRS